MISTYRITNTDSGADLGAYDGETIVHAYLAMLEDAKAFRPAAEAFMGEAAAAGDWAAYAYCRRVLGMSLEDGFSDLLDSAIVARVNRPPIESVRALVAGMILGGHPDIDVAEVK